MTMRQVKPTQLIWSKLKMKHVRDIQQLLIESKAINGMRRLLIIGLSLLSLLYSTTSTAGIISWSAQLGARKGGVIIDQLGMDWELLLGGLVAIIIVVLTVIIVAARWKASRVQNALSQSINKDDSKPENETTMSTSKEKWFFGKLANGDFGLAKTYWFYGVLVGFIVSVVMKLIASIGLLVIVMLTHAAYGIPLIMGIWRAATKYEGSKIWAVLAKIAVVLGVIMLATNLILIVRLLGQA